MNRASMLNSTIGEYRVTNFLGEGGMGEVYRAVHTKIGQVVAIKILTQHSRDTNSNQRFTWEAQVQAQLNHQNIATFHGFIEHEGCACIVMEYVDGQTLSDRIRHSGPLPVNEALTIFRSIVEAVAYIHSHKIIHRDIKSNNIKIASNGRVKLLDFGIASSTAAPRLTMTGVVVGALESLSPEQLRGARADERSDIWALGVLLYEMLTGRMPFEAQSVGEICEKTNKGLYPPPSKLNPSVPREFEAMTTRCLKKNPDDRFQTASSLLEETRRAGRGLSDSKSRSDKTPDTWKRLLDFSRRQKKILLPVLAAILIAGFYFLTSSSNPPSGKAGPVRAVIIRTTEGPARVYSDGGYLGDTPLNFEAQSGERFKLKLKREGFRDKEFSIQVGEGVNEYAYTLEKIDVVNR